MIGNVVSDAQAKALDQAIRGGATALAVVHSDKQAKNLQLWLDAPELFIADVKSKDYGLAAVAQARSPGAVRFS